MNIAEQVLDPHVALAIGSIVLALFALVVLGMLINPEKKR